MNFATLLFLQSSTVIDEKIKTAPNDSYKIGVIIGSFLPYVLLVIFAYVLYYFMKNKNKNQ
jgi:hypothetical protein